MTILRQVKSHLAANRGRWPEVASGSGVPVSTVRKIAQGVSKDPGVLTVQRLLDYFAKESVRGEGKRTNVDWAYLRGTNKEVA